MCCYGWCIEPAWQEDKDCCCPLEVPCDQQRPCRQNSDCVDMQVCCNSTEECDFAVCVDRPVPCESSEFRLILALARWRVAGPRAVQGFESLHAFCPLHWLHAWSRLEPVEILRTIMPCFSFSTHDYCNPYSVHKCHLLPNPGRCAQRSQQQRIRADQV